MAGAYDFREQSSGEREPLGEQIRRGQQEAKDLAGQASGVAGELGVLIQQEVRLAKAELGQQVSKAVQSAVSAAAAGLFAMLMLIFAFVGVMLVIGEVLDLWIAAFITAGGLLLLALIAGLIARQRIKQISLVPERTVESVKEDLEWARSQMQSNAR